MARLLGSLAVSASTYSTGLSAKLAELRGRVLVSDEGDTAQWQALLLDIHQMYGGMGSLNDYLSDDPEAAELSELVRGLLKRAGWIQPPRFGPVARIGPPHVLVPADRIAVIRSAVAACPQVAEAYLYSESPPEYAPVLVLGVFPVRGLQSSVMERVAETIAAALDSLPLGIPLEVKVLEEGSLRAGSVRLGSRSLL